MNVAAVMDGLADALREIGALRVFEYPPDSVAPPAAIVGYPSELDYDSVMGGVIGRADVPVHVVVGKASDRAARDAVAAYMDSVGTRSVKAAIEADVTLGGAAETVRVVRAAGVSLTLGGVSYVAAEFTVDVIA